MRTHFLGVLLFVAGAGVVGASLQGQAALPAPLAQQIHDLEAQVAQPAGQNDGEAWWRLAMLQQDAAEYREAERSYLRAIPLLEEGNRVTLANALDSAGTMYVEVGDYAHAEPLELRALGLRKAGKDSLGEGVSWMHLAMLSLGRRDVPAAVRYAQLAKGRLVDGGAGSAATPVEKMTALAYLGIALCANGRGARAIAPIEQAQRIAVAEKGSAGEFSAGYLEFLLGYAWWHAGDTASAGRLMKSGTAAMEAQLGFGHPTYVAALTEYRNFLEQAGDLAAAALVRARLARMQPPVEMASAGPGER